MRDFGTAPFNFYPRPPRGERPDSPCSGAGKRTDFYPRPPRGERPAELANGKLIAKFLSTPSARRATLSCDDTHGCFVISIHALREESDGRLHLVRRRVLLFLSTPSARRATRRIVFSVFLHFHFYPRPPRGERPRTTTRDWQHWAFLSTPSARRATLRGRSIRGTCAFLSTPSARRATSARGRFCRAFQISIHALREESDTSFRVSRRSGFRFLSTPSARRATDRLS